MKALRKLNRTLESTSRRIGQSNDTTSWRKTFNYELGKGVQLVLSLQTAASRIRAQSMHNEDKLISPAEEQINKFNKLKGEIDEKLAKFDPINDENNNPFGTDDGSAYGNGGGGAYGDSNTGDYVPPSQQLQQQEMDELVAVDASMAADLDAIKNRHQGVVKVCHNIILYFYDHCNIYNMYDIIILCMFR